MEKMTEKQKGVMSFLEELCEKFDGNKTALHDYVENRYQKLKALSITAANDQVVLDLDKLLYNERLNADKNFILERLKYVFSDMGWVEIASRNRENCLWNMPRNYWDDKELILKCVEIYPGTYSLLFANGFSLRDDDDVIQLALSRGYNKFHEYPLCTNMAKGYARCKLNPAYQERLESRIKKKFEDSGMDFVTYYERNILKKTLSKELDKKQATKRVNKI